jgi:lipooligosaccharide transport system permease protein
MGYGLGSLVDARGTAALGGVPYVVFVAPAVLCVQSMNSGLGMSLYPVFGSLRWNAVYIAARATPLRPADICRGHLLYNSMRIAMHSAFFIVVMAALGLVRSPWGALLLPAALLTGLAFSAVTMAWAVSLKSESALAYPVRFIAIPLMLFSGTFFPVTQLPAWIRPVAYATPLWHGVALCRALSTGTVFATTGGAVSAAVHVAYLAALTAFGVWLAGRRYARRLYV